MDKEQVWNRISIEPRLARQLFWPLWVVSIIILAFWQIWSMGYRFNATPSLPRGIYKYSEETPVTGDLVALCLNEKNSTLALERQYLASGSCPTGARPLLKKVAGLPGDQVVQTGKGISVNGIPWANSAVSEFDRQNRPMQSVPLSGFIPEGMALVLSDQHAGSFDSRYFGFIPLASLQKVIPVFLME